MTWVVVLMWGAASMAAVYLAATVGLGVLLWFRMPRDDDPEPPGWRWRRASMCLRMGLLWPMFLLWGLASWWNARTIRRGGHDYVERPDDYS